MLLVRPDEDASHTLETGGGGRQSKPQTDPKLSNPLQIANSSSRLPIRDRWAPVALSPLLQTAKLLHPSLEEHHSRRRASVPTGLTHTLPRASSPSTARARLSSPTTAAPSPGPSPRQAALHRAPPRSRTPAAPAAALHLPWLQPGPTQEPVGWKRSFGFMGAGNLHRHLRVMAGTKGTLLGVPPARRKTVPAH